jgi:hypothetical protein
MFGVALLSAPTSVLAQARVRGSPEAVSVEAKNTSVEDILAALSNAFGVHYRSSAKLQKRLTATYEGSLHKVTKRILEGYDFILKTGDGGMEVIVLGSSDAAPAIEASSLFQVVGRLADDAPAQLSPAIVVAEPPAPPAPPANPSAAATEPSPEIAVAEAPALPANPVAPSSRGRHEDHVVVDRAKGSRSSLLRTIKVAGGARHRGSPHVRHARLAYYSIFDLTFGRVILVSSYRRLPWVDSCRAARICFSRIDARRRHVRSQRYSRWAAIDLVPPI